MLSNKFLNEVLKINISGLNISDIHWKAQDSDRESILFYKIHSDQKSKDLFAERVNHSVFGWLIVNEDHPSRPLNSSVIEESLWPEIQKKILDELFPLPELKLIAVTGTNGKTTTADLVLQLAGLSGKSGISIGTLGVREKNRTILDFGLTSPSLIDLRKFIYKYGSGKDFCVLEASSHALIQNRLYGLKFDMGGWLSFSQDHLDYHKTMEEYFSAKLLLFNYLKEGGKVFVPEREQDLFSKIHRVTDKVALAKTLEGKLPLFFSTRFNRNNLEVAVEIVQSVFNFKVGYVFDHILPPDGRFFIRPYKTNYIVVDFAHTPDALQNICEGIKESFPNHKLKVLFGCGGDRDRTKRPMMGKIAETLATKVYVTSDNPRSENPEQIIDDIVQVMDPSKYIRITDRSAAVNKAFSDLQENEILLLAGKGHEDYILINGVKHSYSDIGEVEKFLSRNSHG